MSSAVSPDRATPRLGALLRIAHENVQAAVYEQTAAAGYGQLRPAHFRLLRSPGVDGTRPSELARRLNTTKQAVNPLLNDLEAWGYIERHADPHDRRGRVVGLTSRGRELMATIADRHQQIEKDWAERAGPGRFHTLLQVLNEIARAP